MDRVRVIVYKRMENECKSMEEPMKENAKIERQVCVGVCVCGRERERVLCGRGSRPDTS